MNELPSGEREPIRRCFARSDGRIYYGEVYGKNNSDLRFTDPEHPRLRQQPQSPWQWVGTTGSTNTNVVGVVFRF